MSKVKLAVQLGGLKLKNPVLTASGTFGYGLEYATYVDLNALGGVIVKGTTLEPREGNPPPRVVETPAGMLNAIGLQNPGVEEVINCILPRLENFDTAIIVNIAGNTVDEYAEIARRLDRVKTIAALEVNISCPNVKKGGMAFGVDPVLAAEVVAAVRANTSLPVIAKLSPNVTDPVAIAEACVAAGADVLSMINTLLGMAIDINSRRPVLANIFGGLSGPAIKPIALRVVWQVSQAVDVPVIGMGGIMSANDALEFLLAGASAVAVGTANFVNPRASLEVLDGIRKYCERNGFEEVNQMVGLAWKEGTCFYEGQGKTNCGPRYQ